MESWKKLLLRSAGFGAGFALVAALILGTALWWSGRPAKPKPWNTQAITSAGKTGLLIQTRAEVYHLLPECNLKNNTGIDYKTPDAGSGTLMSIGPDSAGMEKVDGATWDTTLVIPAGQVVKVKFDIPYDLSSFGETASNLTDEKKLTEFTNRRVKQIRDLKFLDLTQRYEIDCPSSWNDKRP